MAAVRLLPAIAAALLSIVVLFIYTRAHALHALYSNAPARLQRVNYLTQLDVRYADVLRSCEDAEMSTSDGFVILSCDPGRGKWNTVMGNFQDPEAPSGTGLYLWHYADSTTLSRPRKLQLLDFDAAQKGFHPLGIAYHAESQTLFVVNHAESGSRLEIFRLSTAEYTAQHIRTVEHLLIHTPNAVAVIDKGRILMTNDHQFRRRYQPWLATIENYLGLAGGTITYIEFTGRSFEQVPVMIQDIARLPFANGIACLNATMLAVSSSSTNSVRIYHLDHGNATTPPRLTAKERISLPFHPDNLNVDDQGTLLIAGHPHLPSLEEVSRNDARCNDRWDSDKRGCHFHGLSWIAQWDEVNGLRTLYAGEQFGTSTTAVRDTGRGVGFATGLYERGLLTWKV